jgi:DNA-binding transcriptional LysR family regulator
MNWDDVRLFLAVARSETLTRASASLDVSHSTVSRRLSALEAKINVALFDHSVSGYSRTEAGEAFYESALRMEEEFLRLTRTLAGRDALDEQTVQVSVPDVLANHLAPHLAAFRRRVPHIRLEISVENAPVDLNRREADIVLRASREPEQHLVGTRVGQTAWAVYVARPRKRTTVADADLAWIGYGRTLASLPVVAWMREHVPEERIALRTDSSVAAEAYARAGLGAACLWCLAGDRDRQLVRLTPPLPGVASDLWLLTHPDLRRSQRISTVRSFLARALRAERGPLEGRLAPEPP